MRVPAVSSDAAGEADLLLKCGAREPRKAHEDDQHVRTKTDTGR